MDRTARIEKKIRESLAPYYFELRNESHMHSVPKDSETHFKLLIVDDRFKGMSRVDSQRLVYGELAGEFNSGLHALALKCISQQDWEANQQDFQSPPCHSKS